MINSSQMMLITIALLALGVANPPSLWAAKGGGQPITVYSITPDAAYQGDVDVPVNLKGSGFGSNAKVMFLEKDTGMVGNIAVRDVVFDDVSTDLNFTIDVDVDAKISDYEVQVTVGGRKGKGTTFTVRERLHQNVEVRCDEFAPYGTCDCRFMLDPDTGIHKLLGNCQTSETLWLYHARIHSIDGGSNGLWPTLTAVNCDDSAYTCKYVDGGETKSFAGGFHGSSVIANSSDVVGVRYFRILFAESVSRGCSSDADEPDIQSAIRFALDGDTFDDPEMNSLLQVWDMDIDSSGDPLCTAVELVRTPEFTKAGETGNRDWRIRVENSYIADGSYVESAIRLAGMQPQQDINPPLVFGNYIGAPDCFEGLGARGIELGGILLSDPADPSSLIPGVVESNVVRMACGNEVGIWVEGETDLPLQTTAEIVKNDVSGAPFGVMVDANVLKVNFSGNTLVGDESTGSTGIYSRAKCTEYRGKPDRISDYDIKTDDWGCP